MAPSSSPLLRRPTYRDGTIPSTKALSLMWQPEAVHICSTSDTEFVEWMVVDANGSEIFRTGYSSWEVASNRKALFAGRRREALSGNGLTDSELALGAMHIDNAAEIRLQFTDDCGERYLSKFSLDGIRSAMEQLVEASRR